MKKKDFKKLEGNDITSENELCQFLLAGAEVKGADVYRVQNTDVESWQLKLGEDIVRLYPVRRLEKKIPAKDIAQQSDTNRRRRRG